MLIICADITSRGLLNKPLPGVAEIVSLSIVALVFLQLAHTVKSGRMPRVQLVQNWLDKSHPRYSAILRLIAQLLGAIVFAIILDGSYPTLIRSINTSEYVGVQGTFTAPTWPAKLSVVVGSGLVCLQYLLLAGSTVASLIRGK
jgi:TRAP-type C4-dicarboxylate transport system permease small subunit